MAESLILLDTSIVIDYFRKKDKTKTRLYELTDHYEGFVISVITEFEIYVGAKADQLPFLERFLNAIPVIPFDSSIAEIAVDLNSQLKASKNQIAIADLFIASTAISLGIPCASLNHKHFGRLKDLVLV